MVGLNGTGSDQHVAAGLNRIADQELPSMDSLVRQIKRWESGEVAPGEYYADLLGHTFRQGLTVAEILS